MTLRYRARYYLNTGSLYAPRNKEAYCQRGELPKGALNNMLEVIGVLYSRYTITTAVYRTKTHVHVFNGLQGSTGSPFYSYRRCSLLL